MTKTAESYPTIDLFAGPGGLAEGFSHFSPKGRKLHPFHIRLSVEKDECAHRTLRLRAFFRWFRYRKKSAPTEYYLYLAGKTELSSLKTKYPEAWSAAESEAMLGELGNGGHQDEIDQRISEAINGERDWILIGGPPCQAYSLVGRARRSREKVQSEETRERHVLYRQYLRVICRHAPAVFVMENVKGILSSKLNGELIFPKILQDLEDPPESSRSIGEEALHNHKYHILSFVTGNIPSCSKEYLIRSEDYGIPQNRHRVILFGVRDDLYGKIGTRPFSLSLSDKIESVRDVLKKMPELRSGFSKGKDSTARWNRFFSTSAINGSHGRIPEDVHSEILDAVDTLRARALNRENKKPCSKPPSKHSDWYYDKNLLFLPNHEARAHMDSDLLRYLFVSSYGSIRKTSPRLSDFPEHLLPNHENARDERIKTTFADRFKVQLWDKPSSTVTSHISKDGHYFIHPDPKQCRSLTVREAARLQTFPDNYFFEGGRTQQYHQVGNAVPPLLARQLAEVVYRLLEATRS